MLTDRHARGQPSTCVRHKDLSCLTTGRPAQHVALVTKPALQAGAPFISLRNTEDDGRCFPRWAVKWLPLSKDRGCTWLMNSCVSCKIARHLERPDRKKRTRDERSEMKREKKKTKQRSCLDLMPEKGSPALSNFKWPLCEIVVSNANNLTILPHLSPIILHSSSVYRQMCRLTLSQKHATQKWVLWNFTFTCRLSTESILWDKCTALYFC